jgi:hypothetical protein
VVVGDEILRLLVRPERGHQHEPLNAGVLRRSDEVARPLLHHALKLLGRAGEERNEVDDDVLSCRGAPETRSVGHVAHRSLLVRQRRAAPRLALQHSHRVPGVDERPDDRRADEARCARDEDPHGSKFFQ